MTLAKVKEQDGMTVAKVRHAQVSHAPYWSAKRLARLHDLKTERLYNISYGRALES